ncbi:MAG TPA: ATP-binding protein [Chitinophagaceae bacterium]|jgi:two-component system, NtrC family, sensor kinase|nr:ATP-binding protein [Chitinophagaceae bacterium]
MSNKKRLHITKSLFLILIGLLTTAIGQAQANEELNKQALLRDLSVTKEDSTRVDILRELAEYYIGLDTDSSLLLAKEAFDLSNEIEYDFGKVISLFTMGKVFAYIGNYNRGLALYLQSLKLSEKIKNPTWIAYNLLYIGQLYNDQGDGEQALRYFFKCRQIVERNGLNTTLASLLLRIGQVYENMGKLDSAGFYFRKSYVLVQKYSDDYWIGKIQYSLGELGFKTGDLKGSMEFYKQSMASSQNVEDYIPFCNAGMGIANLYNKLGNTDSAIFYARQSLTTARKAGFLPQQLDASDFFVQYFKSKKIFDSAFSYQEISSALKDSLISREKMREFQKISFSEQVRQMEIEQEKAQYRSRVKVFILLGGMLAFLVVAAVMWRNVRLKQKANKLLTAQKLEIEKQRGRIEESYQELKAAQKQLIQSEKMASLGELTAGIAHEIQNPLNFVNNFSEVNVELLAEMTQEIEKGNFGEAKSLANDVIENHHKINQHGKRADSIVKGMLQHTRASTGQKELTDINILADEYLRLAYHGLRAKDKSFNATFKSHLDHTIGKINVVPQDIGRVILNLVNNAFYAVTEKQRQNISGYEPTVTLIVKKVAGKIEIIVSDNGNGVPQKVLDKIFQPFFTTKPTGQGTGLGLSLSYDIIKAHGGEIKIETKEGEGSEFIIQLPQG